MRDGRGVGVIVADDWSPFNDVMRIVPVMDVWKALVVHAVGGRRDEYRPINSRLTPSVFPVSVADAFREEFGFDEIYIADLDAIAGGPPQFELSKELRRREFSVWIDAGVRRPADAEVVARSGSGVVLGLETLAGPAVLFEVVSKFPDRVLFSLDLKAGVPLGDTSPWGVTDPQAIAARAIDLGVRRLLVLDLARVGEGAGCGTEELCARLAAAHPDVELWAGGGVRDASDLERLRDAGVRVALVASALHDDRISRTEAQRWR